METRLQYLLLRIQAFAGAFLLVVTASAFAAKDDNGKKKLRIDSELFDIGVVAGVINFEDFPAEFVLGANVTFKASENFFLQYNFVQSDISESSFEKNPADTIRDLGDRKFTHYDLLVGYNLFQGEFFAGSEDYAHLSSLYVVGGIGDTEFGGEDNFTYTVGLGYQIEFYRKYLVRFDYRDYIYQTSLIVGSEQDTVHNTQISLGVGYLF